MSLYYTGDAHGKFNKFSHKRFDYDGMTQEEDFIVILGDFGGVFLSKPGQPECKEENYWLNWLEEKPVTFIIVPGNHENYDAVEANYPLDYFKGARARYLRKNVIWIERGEIIELCGKKLWCFGGAYSIDKAYRTPEISWWHREQPTQNEMDYGFDTLEKNLDSIDYILTHDAPSSVLSMLYGPYSSYPSKTERYLERILWKSEGKIP